MKNSSFKYNFYAIAAGIFWGLIGLFTRYLNEGGVNSAGILLLRSGGCMLVFALAILLRDPKQFCVTRRQVPFLLLFGVSTLTFTLSYYQAITYASLGAACTLMYCQPVFVMLISLFVFREKFTARKLLALLLCVVGCALVSGLLQEGEALQLKGILYGLLAGVLYAVYAVLSKILSNKENCPVLTLNFYGWAVSALGAVLLYGLSPAAPAFATAPRLLATVGLFLISGAIPSFLYSVSLSGTEAGRAAVMSCTEPVTAMLLGFLVYRENPGITGVLGIILVLSAVILLNIPARKNK